MKVKLSRAVWSGGALLSAAIAIFSYRYVVKIGFVPPNVVANLFFNPWIMVHAGAASTALLLGPLQFLAVVRRRWPRFHRWIGWTYVISCLVGGASGLVLASGVSTGIIARLGFGALGILWLGATAKALLMARARDFPEHRRWMIRSFALTFSAVTLRLYIPISLVLGLDFITAYRAIAWLAWVPNALMAEWYLRRVMRASTMLAVTPSSAPSLVHHSPQQ